MKKFFFFIGFILLFFSLYSQEWEDIYILYGKGNRVGLYSLSKKAVVKNIFSEEEVTQITDISPDYFLIKTAEKSYLIDKKDFSSIGIEYKGCKYGFDKYYVYGENGVFMFFPDKMVATNLLNRGVEDIFIDKYQLCGWKDNKIYVYANRMLDSIMCNDGIKKVSFFSGNPRLIFIDNRGRTEIWGIFPSVKIFTFPGRYENYAINGDRYVVLFKKNVMSLWNRRSFVHLRDTILPYNIKGIKVREKRLYVITDSMLYIMDDTFHIKKDIKIPNIVDVKWGPDNIIALSLSDSILLYNVLTDSTTSIHIDSSYAWDISSQRLDVDGIEKISLNDSKVVIKKEEKKETELVHGFSIQVSATSSLNGVDNLQRKFREAGIPVYYKEFITGEGKVIYRIRVGVFDTKETAEIFKNYIIEKFPQYSSLWYVRDSVSLSKLSNFNKKYVIVKGRSIYIVDYKKGVFSLDFGYSSDYDIVPGSIVVNKNEVKCKLSDGNKLRLYWEENEWKVEIIKNSLKDSIS